MPKKSPKQLDQEIAAFLDGSNAPLYWPGGSGGGCSRRRVQGKAPVVRPHARTSPSCRRCGQFHTTSEHELEAAAGDLSSLAVSAATAARKPAHGTARRPAAPRRPAPASPLVVVRDAAAKVKAPGRFGDRKVFVSALWQRVGNTLGMSLDAFKQWLVVQHRAGVLQLARADLVAAMDPDLVAASEIRFGNATFHFLVDPPAKEPR